MTATNAVVDIAGDRIVLRPLAEEHVAPIVEIGSEPGVARWWPGIDEDRLRRKMDGRSEAVGFAVEHGGEVIGLVQYCEFGGEDFRHAGIDLFLTTSCHGHGLGADTVRTLANHLVNARGHHRLVIDPALANERAIRCYERVGFRRVGVMRRYWLGPDGAWHDGLLLDLLSDDLDGG